MSVDPLVRAGMLPDAPHLQWDTCLKAALPCRERAVEIERALHEGLSVFRVQVHGFDGESWDGGSEWFELPGLSHAVNLLSDMPISDESRELAHQR